MTPPAALRFRWRESARILLPLAVLGLVSAALGAHRLQQSSGGSWLHAVVVSIPVVVAISTAVGVIVIVAHRDRGDGMPAELWVGRPADPAVDARIYRAPPTLQSTIPAFVICMTFAAPFVILGAWAAGPLATILVDVWAVSLIVGIRAWWRSAPSGFKLTDHELWLLMPGGEERQVPIRDIAEIRWPDRAVFVSIVYTGGRLGVPRTVEGLDELVVELRRRNRNIRFDGRWPPHQR
jgi:hypothetical protein